MKHGLKAGRSFPHRRHTGRRRHLRRPRRGFQFIGTGALSAKSKRVSEGTLICLPFAPAAETASTPAPTAAPMAAPDPPPAIAPMPAPTAPRPTPRRTAHFTLGGWFLRSFATPFWMFLVRLSGSASGSRAFVATPSTPVAVEWGGREPVEAVDYH